MSEGAHVANRAADGRGKIPAGRCAHTARTGVRKSCKQKPPAALPAVFNEAVFSAISEKLREIDLLELLLENLARLEFHDGALGNHHLGLGFVGVAADALFADLHFEHAEISQLDIAAVGERLLDDVEGLLNRVDDLFLGETGFPENLQHNFSFR
jgi:hypothetical protein